MSVCDAIASYLAENRLNIGKIAHTANILESDLKAMLCGKLTMYPDDLRAICYALNVSADIFILS